MIIYLLNYISLYKKEAYLKVLNKRQHFFEVRLVTGTRFNPVVVPSLTTDVAGPFRDLRAKANISIFSRTEQTLNRWAKLLICGSIQLKEGGGWQLQRKNSFPEFITALPFSEPRKHTDSTDSGLTLSSSTSVNPSRAPSQT